MTKTVTLVQSSHYMLDYIMLWLAAKVMFNTQWYLLLYQLYNNYSEALLVWGDYPATNRKSQPLKVGSKRYILI